MTASPRPRILDGGMGRELARIGAPFRQPEWSALALIEGPDWVERAHRNFVEAGAEIITTNSYALVPFHLGEARWRDDAGRLADLAGRIARRVADDPGDAPALAVGPDGTPRASRILVAGSLPPTFGSYRPDLFDDAHADALYAPLVRGLLPWVDVWLCETLSSVAEARAAVRSVDMTGRVVWVSFTLDDALHGGAAQLRSGESVTEAVRAVAPRAGAVMFNCSQPEVMAAALEEAAPVIAAAPQEAAPVIAAAPQEVAPAHPVLGVYANAFPPQRTDAAANADVLRLRDDLTPARYAEFAATWRARGASILGGCCGVTPGHVAALCAAMATPVAG
jgi:homocysteine S-methyltransferase